jgi:hypothetical protein
MAVGPSVGGVSRWWIVTSGELWTNVSPGRESGRVHAAWAKTQLKETPSMATTIDRVLEHTKLSTRALRELDAREKSRGLIPLIDLRATFREEKFDRLEELSGGEPLQMDEGTARKSFQIFLQATWSYYETKVFTQESGTVATALYELRRQIAFAAEDAWNERTLHLSRIERGEVADDQAEALRARVEALETVLDHWGWRIAAQEEQ